MKLFGPFVTESRSCVFSLFTSVSLLCLAFFIGTVYIGPANKQLLFRWGTSGSLPPSIVFDKCKEQYRPPGSETLPAGIVVNTSNLEMRPLWGSPKKKTGSNLLAMAVGIKQKDIVSTIVKKFLSSGFVVMLFHYDGIVDDWKRYKWTDSVIHVSARNQTKWWFAKRFLHPDIVVEYSYIFLWDEDLGVEHFDPQRYLWIINEEGLEISQPALDPSSLEIHHQITARSGKTVHRRTYKAGDKDKGGCDESSNKPPCTGWIEIMAPVFSRASWRCVWYMIQNDLIHAWGLDTQLGYCALGDRMKNIGVVDAEYIIHLGRPTLGEDENREATAPRNTAPRIEVRRQSFIELDIFRKRWSNASIEDQCWVDLYPETQKDSSN